MTIDPNCVKEVYAGTEYSRNGTHYALFVGRVDERPVITMSWEHSSYEWLDKLDFLEKAKNANDTYMHMVHDVIATL